ncbi:tetratricopeptide repeat protein [Fulvivirgaceae bacterium BMA12]|uniref:Tetratricopeptide repeat protein n=1 Tax=Agaribacillus aureus TaxID=3051825 RepID=A0ABT8LHI0_9BACT|nr:tetratricopeptide repeat protein [Fulvivirgaceae bacterium BMA12]
MKVFNTVFIIVLFCCQPVLMAQQHNVEKEKRKLAQAETMYANMDYRKAIELYKQVKVTDKEQFVKLRIASSYKNVGDLQSAEEWYRKASSKQLPVEDQYAYAEVLMSNGKHDEASEWYRLHAQHAPDDSRSKSKLAAIANLSSYYEKKDSYEVQLLNINSSYSEFGVSFLEDGIVFASTREEVAPKKRYNRTNSAYLDLYQSKYDEDGNLGAITKLGKNVNTKYHEGPAVIYAGGNKMIFTRNNADAKVKEKDHKLVSFQLFETQKDKKGDWDKPRLLSFGEEKYSVGHAAVSQNGKLLYFSSNRPGGIGGTDLYVSENLNGGWGTPKNLGDEINTEGNEMFPFISGDSLLYFSSDGKGGLGGLDIYRTSLTSQQSVENLGAPINSEKDDFAFVLHKEGNWGYFSSNRPGGIGDDDLYYFSIKAPQPKLPPEPEVIPNDTIIAEKPEPTKVYVVQILALLNPVTVHKSFLQDLEGVVKHDGKDGFHRYTYGEYEGLEEALESLEKIIDKGYSDAFLRRIERYSELSKGPGKSVDELYISEAKKNAVF